MHSDMCCRFDVTFTYISTAVDADLASDLARNAPIATKVVCFSRLLKCLEASMANSVDPDQTAPIGAVCSGSTLFAHILNISVK